MLLQEKAGFIQLSENFMKAQNQPWIDVPVSTMFEISYSFVHTHVHSILKKHKYISTFYILQL